MLTLLRPQATEAPANRTASATSKCDPRPPPRLPIHLRLNHPCQLPHHSNARARLPGSKTTKIIMAAAAAAAAAEATAPQPHSSHRRGRVPSHTSNKNPKGPRLKRAWNSSPGGSRSPSAADALQRRAPVLASGSASTIATPPPVPVGLGRDSCGALRASRVRMRVRRSRLRLRRENDRLLAMASGPRGGLESQSRQFKNFSVNLAAFLENPTFSFFFSNSSFIS